MRLVCNAPLILSYAGLSLAVLLVDTVAPGFAATWCSSPSELHVSSPLFFLRLFTYVLGHASWNHLIDNFTVVLLVGPVVEERYGATRLLAMIAFTAVAAGLLNALFFPTSLMGASGVAFLLIVLVSFRDTTEREIPLTFVLVFALFLGRELLAMFREDNISQFAHIIGGVSGGVMGLVFPAPRRR